MRKKPLFSSPVLRFFALACCAVILAALPRLFSREEGDAGMALYFICLYAVIPLCAALISFWAGRGGVHPLAACLPIGCATLLYPIYPGPGMGAVCVLLSLVGCVAGQEWEKRKNEKKGNHHGGKRKR